MYKSYIKKTLQDENISNEFYKKYVKLRVNLFENIVKNNQNIDKLILLAKTQTILDRMIFIFFAEDRGILPTNTITSIIDRYKDDIENRPLYHFYKIYFEAINSGNNKLKISAYNGGLFAKDDILDNLIVDDETLDDLPKELSGYDFNSEIDVNILGHIFENSLSDMEEMRADIEGKEFDSKKSKRKKDGIFYTPEYITKYIVDNTLGKLCLKKKEELELSDIEIEVPKNPKKLNKKEQKVKKALEDYRGYLLGLKILDPACGSGVFLNQALSFLLTEHNFIDAGIKTLMGGAVLGLYDIKKDILENNLYGVDINAEAVEIAKLSLWLRTVESGRKLNKLASKIKVGNSLIDDRSVTEDAFVWEEEFAEVFEKGGFDVVIGNPPYIDSENMTKNYTIERKWISKNYKAVKGNWDIFIPFIELGFKLVKDNRYLSYIIPNKILSSKYGNAIRDYINSHYCIVEIVDLSQNNVFDVDVYPIILLFQKQKQNNRINITYQNNNIFIKKEIMYQIENNWALYLDKNYTLYSKLFNSFDTISTSKIYNIYSAASVSEAYEIKEFIKDNRYCNDNELKLINTGTIDPYLALWGYAPMQYIKNKYLYPIVAFDKIKVKEWTKKPKVVLAGMVIKLEAFVDIEGSFLPLKSTTVITSISLQSLKLIALLLNSKLITFVFKIANSANTMAGGYLNVNQDNIGMLPIPKLNRESDILYFSKKTDTMINLNKSFQSKQQKFLKRLKSNFDIEKLSKKLETFYKFDFKTFLKELKKKKVVLSLKEQDEWEEYFESYQKELLDIKIEINKTDNDIDEMVYGLYDLSEDEKNIIRESLDGK